jgi:hypothetical protein
MYGFLGTDQGGLCGLNAPQVRPCKAILALFSGVILGILVGMVMMDFRA